MMAPSRVPMDVTVASPASVAASLASPKSSTLTRPSRVTIDVGRLDVAMDDAGGVRGFERRGDLHGILERAGERQRPRGDDTLECGPLDELHDERVRFLDDIEDLGDVRVVERRGGARFLHEAPTPLWIRRRVCRQQFDRDAAPQACVHRGVDDAHAAGAERAGDLVGAETGARFERHDLDELYASLTCTYGSVRAVRA